MFAPVEPSTRPIQDRTVRGTSAVDRRRSLRSCAPAIGRRAFDLRPKASELLGTPPTLIVIEAESITEIVTGFGIKGVSAETVASDACDEAERYLKTDVPVGSHLADQLLIPMALAGGGSFRTLSPSAHTETDARVIRRFLDVPIAIDAEAEDTFRITIGPK